MVQVVGNIPTPPTAPNLDNAIALSSVKASYAYDSFGEMTQGKPEQGRIFGFNGEEYNGATGYQYLRARHYNVSIGRFDSKDSYLGEIAEKDCLRGGFLLALGK